MDKISKFSGNNSVSEVCEVLLIRTREREILN